MLITAAILTKARVKAANLMLYQINKADARDAKLPAHIRNLGLVGCSGQLASDDYSAFELGDRYDERIGPVAGLECADQTGVLC